MTALDRPLFVTFFKSYAATEKREEAYACRALAERIRTVTAARKDLLPWLKLARFGDRRTDKNSLRHDANVLMITGIEADYDGGAVTVDDAADRLAQQGVAAILYTSPSHTPQKPRWRVLCPLSAEMPPDRRAPMVGRLNGLLGGILARESFTLSQSFYFGSVAHNPAHRVELIDGTPIDLHDDLDTIWRGPSNAPAADPDAITATGDERDLAELVRRIVTAEELHGPLCAVAARLIGRSVPPGTAADLLRGIMLARPKPDRDARWHARFADIGRLVESAAGKFSDAAEQRRLTSRTLARLACRLVRADTPSAEILRQLDDTNAMQPVPIPADSVSRIAVWAATRVSGGIHHAA